MGGKVEAEGDGKPLHGLKGIDDETGEEVDIFLIPRGAQLTRRLTPDPADSLHVAQLDALAFTVVPPDDESMCWVTEQLRQFLPIEHLEQHNGCFGFKESVRFGDGALRRRCEPAGLGGLEDRRDGGAVRVCGTQGLARRSESA